MVDMSHNDHQTSDPHAGHTMSDMHGSDAGPQCALRTLVGRSGSRLGMVPIIAKEGIAGRQGKSRFRRLSLAYVMERDLPATLSPSCYDPGEECVV